MNGYISMQQVVKQLIKIEKGSSLTDEIPQSKGFPNEIDEAIHHAAPRPQIKQMIPKKATAKYLVNQSINQQINQSTNQQINKSTITNQKQKD